MTSINIQQRIKKKDRWCPLKFKETEIKNIGCRVGKCTQYHLSCCYSCPESEGCKTKCHLFLLHESQPSLLRDRECKYLTDAKTLVFDSLFGRDTIL